MSKFTKNLKKLDKAIKEAKDKIRKTGLDPDPRKAELEEELRNISDKIKEEGING